MYISTKFNCCPLQAYIYIIMILKVSLNALHSKNILWDLNRNHQMNCLIINSQLLVTIIFSNAKTCSKKI